MKSLDSALYNQEKFRILSSIKMEIEYSVFSPAVEDENLVEPYV